MKLTKTALLMSLGLSGVTLSTQAALEINLNYTNFTSGAPGDVGTILSGASVNDAIAVMEQAAAIWEDAFAASSSSLAWASGGTLTQNITVGWASHGGGTLAQGGASYNPVTGQWSGGSLNWDNDGSSTFFVDLTPGESSEWQQSSTRSQNLGGVSVNVERVSYDAPAGTARSHNDMLSTALHEIGHALGFSSGYVLYDNADLGNDNDIDITSGPYNGAQIAINGGHTNLSIASPGNDNLGGGQSDFPYDPGGGFFPNLDYNPTVMSPSAYAGVRYGLTEADILIVAQYLNFNMSTVNFNPVPEPTSLALLGLGGLLVAGRRRG